MEALSKASGAETAVGEGDKRRTEPGAGSCYGAAPPSFFKGNSKGGETEWAEPWVRCLSDPQCLCLPLLVWDVFIPADEKEPLQYLMMRMVISPPQDGGWVKERATTSFITGRDEKGRVEVVKGDLFSSTHFTSDVHGYICKIRFDFKCLTVILKSVSVCFVRSAFLCGPLKNRDLT